MATATDARPLCVLCRSHRRGFNPYGLCWRCLTDTRCRVCKKIVPGMAKRGWCDSCKRSTAGAHLVKVQSPGQRPDEETLEYRLELYALRAAQEQPLFDPPAWF